MNQCFMGKILWVNLSTREFKEEILSEDIYRKFLGGYGLGAYFLYRNISQGCDPLGPENILGFCPGLLTGTSAPFTGRFMVCGKSPLTGKGPTTSGKESSGGFGDSNCGGYFAPAIKRAGYDGIFVKGTSSEPVYIFIDSKQKDILSAAELWGKDTTETEKILKQKHGKIAQIASIGKGGENLSLIAGIVNDQGRIAARSGLGAVMGSKKLKAICLAGTQKITMADPKMAIELAKDYNSVMAKFLNNKLTTPFLGMASNMGSLMRIFKVALRSPKYFMAKTMHEFGTSFSSAISAETGDMPIKNFKGAGFVDWPQMISRQFSSANMMKYKKRSYGCFACPVQCGAILNVPELGIDETHRPEYETCGSFGGLILNQDVNVLIQVNEYLNRAGIDTISAGVTLSFILECVEQGILSKEDFKCKSYPEGILPEWNKSDYILPILHMMVEREGIGDIFADGTRMAVLRLQKQKPNCKNLQEIAINANGQELAMHDTRYMKSMLLTMITDPTPGRHTAANLDMASLGPIPLFLKGFSYKNPKDPYKKGTEHAKIVKFFQFFNSLGFCEFGAYNPYPLHEMIQATTGWHLTTDDILQIGHRIQVLRQMFNAREGAIRYEVPKRVIGIPPLAKGPLKDVTIEIEPMIRGYYDTIGFNKEGIPLETTLKELALDFCIPDIIKCEGADLDAFKQILSESTK